LKNLSRAQLHKEEKERGKGDQVFHGWKIIIQTSILLILNCDFLVMQH
jgi:hypothetical protein